MHTAPENSTPSLIEIDTPRLRLRQWRDTDYPAFAALNADPQVMEFFPALLDRATSDELAQRIRGNITVRGWGFWAVEIPNECAFIGFAGLSVPPYETPASPCVEIGWRLARAHWGKGYATEAARAALRVGFDTLELAEIVAFTTIANRRSRAVMERIGMRYEGETFEHPRVPEGHRLRAHVLYRLARADWGGRRGH